MWVSTSYRGRYRSVARRSAASTDGSDAWVALLIGGVALLPLVALLAALALALVVALLLFALLTALVGLMVYTPLAAAFLVRALADRREVDPRTWPLTLFGAAAGLQALWCGYWIYLAARSNSYGIVITAALLPICGYVSGVIARPNGRESAGRKLGLILGITGAVIADKLSPSSEVRAERAQVAAAVQQVLEEQARQESEAEAAKLRAEANVARWWAAQPPPRSATTQRPCPRCAESVQAAAVACWRCSIALVPFATWSIDPSHRFAHRFWDGQRWTAEVVSPDGTRAVDPLGPRLAPQLFSTTSVQPS